jgi:hypothetical protein
MVCGTGTAWLKTLHEALPDLEASEARFIMLPLIARKCHLIGERALDLLVEQVKLDPSLQDLIDDLQSEDADTELTGAR